MPSTANVWVAPGMSGNWNTATNWSLMHIPDSTDIATFNGSSAAVCMMDAPAMGTNTVSGVNITAAQTAFIYDDADLIIGADGFTQAGSQFNVFGSTTITVAGDWSVSSPGVFVGGGTVDFNSTTAQTILNNNNNPFFNLTHSGAGTLNLPTGQGVLQIANNFTNSSGTVDGKGIEIQMLDGNWMDTSSVVNVVTVWFYPGSPITQTIISNSGFNNLMYGSVPASAILRLLTPVTVTGNFTVSTNTFDANNQNMTVGGHWNNLATVENTATVTFNGAGAQFLAPGLSSFNSLIHSGTGTLVMVNNPLMVNSTLDNTAGTFDPNNQPLTVGGLTTIINSSVKVSGANQETMSLNGGVSLIGGTLSSGDGTVILGAGVTATSDAFGSSIIQGNLDLGGVTRTFTISAGLQPRDLIVQAVISNGGITKAGNGSMELAASNQYGGGTLINEGVLDVSKDGALGTDTITAPGNPGDGTVDITGDISNLSDPQIRVGTGGNDVAGQADIFFFALPKLTSPASILGAQLNLQYLGISQFTMTVTPEFNVDLFGLGARSTPTILATDYYDGDASLSTDTLIAKGFITPTTVPGSLQASGAALLNFLESLYQPDGTPTTAYVVFRANADVHLPPNSFPYRGYELASADNTDSSGAFVPRLSLTIKRTTTVAANAILQFSGGVAYNTTESVTLNGGTIRTDLSSGTNSFAGPITLNAAGSMIWAQSGSTMVLTGPINAAGFDLTVQGAGNTILNGAILGTSAATLAMQGSGTLTLNGPSTYGGGTTVNSGTLVIGNDNAVGTGALMLAGGTTILPGGANHSLNNAVILGGVVTIGAGTNTLTLTGVVSGGLMAHLDLNGNLTLSGNNTYGGGTSVNASATLGVSGDLALGSGTLSLNDGSVLIAVGTRRNVFNLVTLTGSATVAGSNDLSFGNTISGSGSLTDSDTGTLTLGTSFSASNSYTGGTTITAGTLLVGGNNFIGDAPLGTGPVTLNNGTVLLLGVGSAGPFTFNNALLLNGTSTIEELGFSAHPYIWAGLISGSGGFNLLTSSNGGVLVLTANNTYSGTTSINGQSGLSILEVDGSQPNSGITISVGAFLTGKGTVGTVTVNGGSVEPSIQSGGEIPAPAILTAANLQMNTGAAEFLISGGVPGTGYSQLRVTGTVRLGAAVANLGLERLSTGIASGTKFEFIENDGTMPISGFFGTVTASPGLRLSITYHGGDGNDLVGTLLPILEVAGRVASSGQWWLAESSGSSFTNTLATTWSTGVTWVDVHTGDFTGSGSGRQEIVGRAKETGQWWIAIANDSGQFTNSLWDTWSTAVTWVDVKVGDFDGDGKMDIVGRALQTGQWWMAQSTGSSFTNQLVATWNPNVTCVDVQVGDFKGDGKADIAGRYLQGGQWWVGVSTGTSFSTSLWTTWNPNVTWVDVNVGDFNGDGKADIVGRVAQSGVWWMGTSTGTSFANLPVATWSTAVTWVDVMVGDFNGDGHADLVGRVLQSGQIWVSLGAPTANGFTTSLWATWNPAATWVDVQVGDFNGDGRSDITGRYLQGGSWWTGVSSGSGFTTSLWGQWNPAVTWVDVENGSYV